MSAISYKKVSGSESVYALSSALLLPCGIQRLIVAHAATGVKSHALNGQALQLAHLVFVVSCKKGERGRVLLRLVVAHLIHAALVVCSVQLIC